MESRKRHRAISRCWVGHRRVLDRQTSVTSHDDLDIVRNASIERERNLPGPTGSPSPPHVNLKVELSLE